MNDYVADPYQTALTPSRIYVRNGCLIHWYEADKLPGSFIRVEQRIHGVDPKVSGEWKGYVHYPNALVVCVGQSLKDYTFDIDPTPESDEYDAGYRRAYGGKRAMSDSVLNGKSEHYRDGYQDGWRDKKRYAGQ